jgi:hypothetical protein
MPEVRISALVAHMVGFPNSLTISRWPPSVWRRTAGALAAFSLFSAPVAAAEEMRAIIIGVDNYTHVPRLRGAAADARDLQSTLQDQGVRDMTLMLDGAADRASVLRAFEGMLTRVRKGDMVFLSIAGHGANEPERIKGSQIDGVETVFLLPGFDPRDSRANAEKILRAEFNHYIRAFESKGARVFFVADACFGGEPAREVDPRAVGLAYRTVDYNAIPDKLRSVASREDSMSSPSDFQRSIVIAAVDKQAKVPEVKIPGAGYRGALSYAVARALEGAADADNDGRITTDEIFSYIRQYAYQLSDERQNIVAAHPAGIDPTRDVITRQDRGIVVQAIGSSPVVAEMDAAAQPAEGSSTLPQQRVTPSGHGSASSALPPRPEEPIRVAIRGGTTENTTGVDARAPFVIVGIDDTPDLLWDAETRDLISGGDVLAHDVELKRLGAAIDRAAAVRWIKLLAGRGPQPLRISPKDRLHHKGEKVAIEVRGVRGRSLVLFDLNGDGTFQLLYPLGSDPSIVETLDFQAPLTAREPFGSDQIVAITSARRMPRLEKALRELDRSRSPAEIIDLLSRNASGDARFGTIAIFTIR